MQSKLIAAVVVGFVVGLQVSGRYQVQLSPSSAYVLRTDKLTGATKAVPIDFSAYANK